MANEQINQYTNVVTVPDNDARFDLDQWTGSAFLSSQIKFSDLKTALGSGNLGNTDLNQSDIVRYFTFGTDEVGNMLVFRNSTLSNALTINGQCDVYNNGLNSIATNLFYGFDTGRVISGDRNTSIGNEALNEATTGDDNVALGYSAGKYLAGTTNPNVLGTQSIYIGSQAYPLNSNDSNSIVIGFNAEGNGSNTVVIGNGSIVGNYFNGDVYATSLQGVGDRNVIADANGKLKIGTAFQLISHYPSVASFPVTGSIEVLYVADDTAEVYIWNAAASQYKKVGGNTIYSSDDQIVDDIRMVKLKQDSSAASLIFQNNSGNEILKVDGARDVFINNLKAPTGLVYGLRINDQGKLISSAESDIYINGANLDVSNVLNLSYLGGVLPDLTVDLSTLRGIYAGSGTVPTSVVASLTDDITFGTNLLRIDEAKTRIGINTDNPVSVFEIVGDSGATAIQNITRYSGNVNGSGLVFRKSRGTEAVPVAVNNKDILGNLAFTGYHSGGAFFSAVAGIQVVADESFTATNGGTFMRFLITEIGTNYPVDRMILTNDGSLLIGTTTNAAKLNVKGDGISSATTFLVENSSSVSNFYVKDDGEVSSKNGYWINGKLMLHKTTTGGNINLWLGENSGEDITSGARNTSLGNFSGRNITSGNNNTFVGYNSGVTTLTGDNNIFIGYNTTYSSNGSNSTVIGVNAEATSNNQFVTGSLVSPYTKYYFGMGVEQTSANLGTAGVELNATSVTGTNESSDFDFTIAASRGTGTGDGGDILFKTAPAGASGSSKNTLVTAMTIKDSGSIGIGTSAPSSSALLELSSTTQGFLPPKMTTAQINAISSPAIGLLVHDTDKERLAEYDSTGWHYLRRTANGTAYITSSSATTISTVNTPVKIAGTTNTELLDNFDDDSGQDNRLRYTGKDTRVFRVNATVSFIVIAVTNKTYSIYIYKYDDSAATGAIIASSRVQRKIANGADIGNMNINCLAELDENDYLEVWIENNTDTTNPTIEYMNLSVK